jgi:glucosamine 6-phosphate synthetase-like amidotransferase/phosphosugar isomerase protein
MYEEILAQPLYLQQLIDRNDEIQALAKTLSRYHRVFLTGCGTSFHAARAGEAIALQIFRGQNHVYAVPAFELVNHAWELGPDDAVIAMTHAGQTPLVLDALEQARTAGSLTVTVTGIPENPTALRVDHTILTGYAHEKSWAHTISYTLSVATLLMVLGFLAEERQVAGAEGMIQQAMRDLPGLVDATLASHSIQQIKDLAEKLADRRLWVIAGTGAGIAVAQETALKAAETHYTPAVGLDIEQVLHGYLPMCDAETLLIVIASHAGTMKRVGELLQAAQRIGIKTLLVASEPMSDSIQTEMVSVPSCADVLFPIIHAIPLHLLCYYTAVAKGFNPDLIRRDDEAYREARACYA